ncbi:MAG TPA: hypothetical protein VF533_01165 [Solirubrobacteraceae bacterium]|jgi:hypothetical protein
MSQTTLLLAGLPESGKTTYLAALFHLLRTQTTNVAELSMPNLPEDRDYLMEAESTWLRFQPLTRTVAAAPGAATIPLVRDGRDIQLSLPDVRGEDYEHLWEYGSVSEQLRDVAGAAQGVMLFVRADHVVAPSFIEQTPQEIDGTSFELEDWRAGEAPTQTKLCDILEQLAIVERSIPVAVVVSAWDATPAKDEDPSAWFQRRLPLLWQLLDTSSLPWASFGISAQGGDLTDPAERARLTSLPDSVSRIADPVSRQGDDLTAPIAWVLAGSA